MQLLKYTAATVVLLEPSRHNSPEEAQHDELLQVSGIPDEQLAPLQQPYGRDIAPAQYWVQLVRQPSIQHIYQSLCQVLDNWHSCKVVTTILLQYILYQGHILSVWLGLQSVAKLVMLPQQTAGQLEALTQLIY